MTQQFSFNLIDEPWIPCLTREGQTVDLNLRETLAQAHNLHDIVCESPLQTVAIYRLMLAILHRNFGPKEMDDWLRLWEADSLDMDKLGNYLDKWHDHFDLFGEKRRFYQHDDDRVKPKSAVSLKYSTGFLHNPLFDHDNEIAGISFTPAQAARRLLAVQQFGFGGLSGIKDKHTDAPCAKGVIFIVRGDTLKETLLLNLIRYPYKYFPLTEFDAPAWQEDNPFDPLEFERSDQPFGYLDYLTWQNRRIWLYPEQTAEGQIVVREWKVGPGLRLGDDIRDPMKHYWPSKQHGFLVEQFDQNRQLWRNSYAYFALHTIEEDNNHPPRTFDWLRVLATEDKIPFNSIYRCKALGIDKDRGKALISRQEEFPLPLRYLQEETLLAQLKDALQRTEQVARALIRALRISGMHLYLEKPDDYGWKSAWINRKVRDQIPDFARDQIEKWRQHSGAERYFWADLDPHFEKFAIGLADEERQPAAIVEWRQRVRDAAQSAFRNALQSTGDVARAYKALVHGEGYLNRRLNELFPKEQQKEVTE
ncbi:MAG: type I-E CRISPR-associated protein Cse1/CasA [Anaerolineae bacterium]